MADKVLLAARVTFMRGLIARGLYDHEMIDLCKASDLFDDVTAAASLKGVAHRKLSRKYIRTLLYRTRKEQRERVFDAGTEIAEAHDRMLAVIREGFSEGDMPSIVQAQRVLNKMLGLRKHTEPERIDIDVLRSQVADMDRSIGMPGDKP